VIDVLTSEGALLVLNLFGDTFNNATNAFNSEGVCTVLTTFNAKPSKLIVDIETRGIALIHWSHRHVLSKLIIICTKILLHFGNNCAMFCEGEWEQQLQPEQKMNAFNIDDDNAAAE
jgi:hypothetical protein